MLINIDNLTFAYPGSYDNVFEGLTLRLDTNWRLGLVGRNGRGKTTLLRLLAGEFKGVNMPVSATRFPYPVDMSRVCADALPDIEQWRLERELNQLSVDLEVLSRPFSSLSGGERTKVLLAALFCDEDSFPLIDEPTSHLDLHGRAAVADYLATKPGFILVSHDRAFLDGCIDHVVSINKSSVEVMRGNYTTWRENRDRRDAYELDRGAKLKKDIRRLEQTAREKAAWSDKAESRKIGFDPRKTEKNIGRRATEGAKSKKLMKRAKDIAARSESALDEKRALLQDFEESQTLKLHPLVHPQKLLVRCEDFSAAYGEKTVLNALSFQLERGDRCALTGQNGSGKSTLLKLIAARDEVSGAKTSGTLALASNLVVSYVQQDASFLSGSLYDYAKGIDRALLFAILRKLGFERVQFEKDMSDYSAGQKKKVLLARSLCEPAHLYIWDEPLNYIDLPSREQLEQLILQYAPTLLLVEHDRAFLEAVANKYISVYQASSSSSTLF